MAPETQSPNQPPRADRSFFAGVLTNRQKWARRAALVVVFAVVGFLAIPPLTRAWAANDEAKGVSDDDSPVVVTVAPAELQSQYEVRKPYTGALVAKRRSTLGFERAGKVIDLQVDEGDRVESGAVLAELDRRHLSARRRSVAAQLAEAKAVLAELKFGPRTQTIEVARAEVRNLEAQRDVAVRNLKRRRELVETNAISREEYDESLYAVRAVEARVDAADKALEELEAGTRVEKVDAQSARIEGLAAELAAIDHDLEDTRLTAPYRGAIVRRRVDEGAIVAAGQAVYELLEDDQLEAWIGVPASIANSVRPGETLKIAVGDQQYDATVASLRAELDPATRTRNLVLNVKQPKPRASSPPELVAGQVVRLELVETIQRDGFWVPIAALAAGERGLWRAYVARLDVNDASQGEVESRPVELLHSDGDRAFVRGALQPGDLVIEQGAHKVVAGQRVTVNRTTAGKATIGNRE